MHLKLLTYARRHGGRKGAKIKWHVKGEAGLLFLFFYGFTLLLKREGLLFGTKRRLNR